MVEEVLVLAPLHGLVAPQMLQKPNKKSLIPIQYTHSLHQVNLLLAARRLFFPQT